MAKDKKSFILYSDIIHTVEKLSDSDAGQLLKHLLRYVNDQNPTTDSAIVDIAFEPIKQQLKRDLVKFEDVKVKRSEAGKAGANKRWQMLPNDSKRINGIAKIAVNDNDNVNVINTIPSYDEFLAYALTKKPNVNQQDLKHKYESWVENNWSINRNGKLQPILKWKATLLNTLPHLREVVNSSFGLTNDWDG